MAGSAQLNGYYNGWKQGKERLPLHPIPKTQTQISKAELPTWLQEELLTWLRHYKLHSCGPHHFGVAFSLVH